MAFPAYDEGRLPASIYEKLHVPSIHTAQLPLRRTKVASELLHMDTHCSANGSNINDMSKLPRGCIRPPEYPRFHHFAIVRVFYVLF
jgi:hypothetical protein